MNALDAKVEKLESKVQLLKDTTEKIGEMPKWLDAAMGELGSMNQALEAKGVATKANVHEYSRLELELELVRAVIAGEERSIQDIEEPVHTEYTSLVRAQASSYRDHLHAVLSNAQSGGEYLGGYLVPVGEDHHCLQLHVVKSNGERGGDTFLPEANGDVFEISPSPGAS